ncbi:MAG: hypothetical protein ABII88_07575 [Candidatus Omnitrophota bacterium]
MKKLFFILLVVLVWQSACFAVSKDGFYNDICDIAYHPGYKCGEYDARAERDYDSESARDNPAIEDFISSLKEQYNCHKPGVNTYKQQQFKAAFDEGWSSGYDDGYYGRDKRKTQFDSKLILQVQ